MLYVVSTTLAAGSLLGLAARRFGRLAWLGAIPIVVFLAPGALVYGRIASAVAPALAPWVQAAFLYGALAMLAFMGALILRPRLRSAAWVAFVTVPGSLWAAGVFLSLPWLVVSSALSPFVTVPAVGWVFFAVAALGVPQSFRLRREVVRVVLGDEDAGPEPRRVAVASREKVQELPTAGGALRLVQITDPHLGAFRSEASLRRICERAVAASPDLVLLTGDFFTREGATNPEALARALEPLRALQGRTFACHGNHDHEAPQAVATALRSAGVRLLVDEAALVETPAGLVQVVGLEHRWVGGHRPPAARLRGEASDPRGHAGVLERLPRVPGALRLVLLHDPSAFGSLPEGSADLVLSGHTHGGHIGLLSVGLPWTVIGALTSIPDHGLWGRGRDRLYVHRGTGHYGFPLRIGVPAEESLLEVAWAR